MKEDYQTFEYNFIKQYYNAENNTSLSKLTINNKLDLKNINKDEQMKLVKELSIEQEENKNE